MFGQAAAADSLAQQFGALGLKGGALTAEQALHVVQGGQWPQQAPASPPAPGGGKDAGQALLRLLQSGGGGKAGPPGQQPLAAAEQPKPLSPPYLNGTTLPPPAHPAADGASWLSGGGGGVPAAQEALPSLFRGSSIWRAVSSEACGRRTLSLALSQYFICTD